MIMVKFRMVGERKVDFWKAWRQERKPEALEQLFCAQVPLVFRTALRFLDNPSDAEDVTQQVFLHLIQSPPAGPKIEPWLYLSTVHAAKDLLKKKARAKRAMGNLEREGGERMNRDQEHPWGAAEASLEEKERAILVRKALAQLPEELREALCLHFDQSLTHGQAAQVMGISTRTFRRRFEAGLGRLRGILGAQGLGLSPEHVLGLLPLAVQVPVPTSLLGWGQAALASILPPQGIFFSVKAVLLGHGLGAKAWVGAAWFAAAGVLLATGAIGLWDGAKPKPPPAVGREQAPLPDGPRPPSLPGLERKVVLYPNAWQPLSNIFQALDRQANIRFAFPTRFAETRHIRLSLCGSTVREVLDRLDREWDIRVEVHNDGVVVWEEAPQDHLETLLRGIRDPDPRKRAEAAFDLGRLGDRKALEALAEALPDPAYPVGRHALEALHRQKSLIPYLKNRQTLETHLLVMLKTVPVQKPRAGTTEMLGLLAHTGGEGAVERILAEYPSSRPHMVLEWLSSTHHPKALSFLLARLEDPDQKIRKEAALYLSRMRLPGAFEALFERARKDNYIRETLLIATRDPRVLPLCLEFRAEGIDDEGLRFLRGNLYPDPSCLKGWVDEVSIQKLEPLLWKGKLGWHAAYSVFEYLAAYQAPGLHDNLLAALDNPALHQVAMRGIEILGPKNDPRIIQKLIGQIKKAENHDKKIIGWALFSRVGSLEAKAFIMESLASPDPNVRSSAMGASRLFEDPDVHARVRELCQGDPDENVRNEAFHLLAMFSISAPPNTRALDLDLIRQIAEKSRNEDNPEPVTSFIKNGGWQPYYPEAAKALTRFLVESLLSPDPRHKSWALRIVDINAMIFPESEFSRLIHAPQRLPNLYALLRFWGSRGYCPRFIEPLLSQFKEADAGGKIEIVWYLGRIPDPRVAEALIAGMKDPRPEIRRACTGMLWNQYSLQTGFAPEVLEALKTAQADPDPEVQKAAGKILKPKEPPQQETRPPAGIPQDF